MGREYNIYFSSQTDDNDFAWSGWASLAKKKTQIAFTGREFNRFRLFLCAPIQDNTGFQAEIC